MAQQLTIRHESSELRRRLKALAESAGTSVNTLVVELLERAVGLRDRRLQLARYTTWTQADGRQFDKHLKAQRTIDAKLWK